VGYFQRARILMMPSRSEGLASAMLEAMSCGCVPVVSDVGNMTDAAKHAFNAYVVSDHMDVEGFTKHIQELLQNEKLRLDIAKNGSEFVHDHYSLQVQSKIFEEMIS
jgi:glycosyltransferase involved in cell wall biosynthesis